MNLRLDASLASLSLLAALSLATLSFLAAGVTHAEAPQELDPFEVVVEISPPIDSESLAALRADLERVVMRQLESRLRAIALPDFEGALDLIAPPAKRMD